MSQTIRHGDLTFPLPDGWFDASQIVAVGPEENGFRPSFVISTEPVGPKETPKSLSERAMAEIAKAAPDFKAIAEKPATFGGVQGVLREYTTRSGKTAVTQLQFYTVRQGTARVFTYTQRTELFAHTRALAELFFASVRIGVSASAMRDTGS